MLRAFSYHESAGLGLFEAPGFTEDKFPQAVSRIDSLAISLVSIGKEAIIARDRISDAIRIRSKSSVF